MCRAVCLQNIVRMGLCVLCPTVALNNFVPPTFHKAMLSPDGTLFILAESFHNCLYVYLWDIKIVLIIAKAGNSVEKYSRSWCQSCLFLEHMSWPHLSFCPGTGPHRKFLSSFWQALFFPKCSTQVLSCLEAVLLRCLSRSAIPVHGLNSLSQDMRTEIQAWSIFTLAFIVLWKVSFRAEAANWNRDCSF